MAKRVRADVSQADISQADLNEAFEGRYIDMDLIQADSQARCSHKCREVLNAPVNAAQNQYIIHDDLTACTQAVDFVLSKTFA